MSEGTCLGVIPLKAGVLGIAAVQVKIINISHISHISYFYLKKDRKNEPKNNCFNTFVFLHILSL